MVQLVHAHLGPAPVAARALAPMRRFVAGCAVAAATLLAGALPAPAEAMTVLQASLPELVQTSGLVMHARTRAVRVEDRRAIGRAVWTVYEFDVIELYKGDRKAIGPRFRLELLGGATADGMTLSVPGMPGFAMGEEVVLLLERHSEGYTLTGAPQGKWTVYRDAQGVARVVRPLDQAHLVRRGQDGRLEHVEPAQAPLLLQPPRADQTLAELRAQLLKIVADQARMGAAPAAPAAAPVALPRSPIGKRKP